MTSQSGVGIHGVGIYLPEVVRKNDWWPASTVAKWQETIASRQGDRVGRPAQELSDGAQKVIAAMSKYAADPFKGAKERRVMPDGMVPSDMEIRAGQDALKRSGVPASEIDLLLTFSQLPDYLALPTAPRVHAELGLKRTCLSIATDSACNSFQTQLALAEQMIKGGSCRYALLVQSSAAIHLIRPEDEHSAWFGDGATAVVVGPVAQGFGVLATYHYTDGSLYEALVGGCPNGGSWFQGGPIAYYFKDRKQAARLAMELPEVAKEAVQGALDKAHLSTGDVDFFACHQGTHWLRAVAQEHIGLGRARHFDSYEFTTSLAASNVPFCGGMAEREGLLRSGDVVAMFSGGSGATVSGSIVRWGVG
jgi:3-oxoacyl-[acyl-carrier-protein] synthase-3